MLDLTTAIIDFENGDLLEQEIFELFQALIDTGMIYHLQGSYQRFAQMLLDEGQITIKNEKNYNWFYISCRCRGWRRLGKSTSTSAECFKQHWTFYLCQKQQSKNFGFLAWKNPNQRNEKKWVDTLKLSKKQWKTNHQNVFWWSILTMKEKGFATIGCLNWLMWLTTLTRTLRL